MNHKIKQTVWLVVLATVMIGGAIIVGSIAGCVVDTATAADMHAEWDKQMAVSQEATVDPVVKAEIASIRAAVQKALDDAVAIAGPDGHVDFGAVVAVVVEDKPEWAWLSDFYEAHATSTRDGTDRVIDGLIGAGVGVAGSAAAPWLTWINAFSVLGRALSAGAAKK